MHGMNDFFTIMRRPTPNMQLSLPIIFSPVNRKIAKSRKTDKSNKLKTLWVRRGEDRALSSAICKLSLLLFAISFLLAPYMLQSSWNGEWRVCSSFGKFAGDLIANLLKPRLDRRGYMRRGRRLALESYSFWRRRHRYVLLADASQ